MTYSTEEHHSHNQAAAGLPKATCKTEEESGPPMDEQAAAKLVLNAIAAECNEKSLFEDLRTISRAIRSGDQLTAKILSGGHTNLAFAVSLERTPNVALFAKLSFAYALWSPEKDSSLGLERTENEFEIMRRFKAMMGADAPVATPYLCIHMDDERRLLVTEWSEADEQLSNQFIDGEIDLTVIRQAAEAIAMYNASPVEETVPNDKTRDCFTNTYPIVKTWFDGMVMRNVKPDGTPVIVDACVEACRQVSSQEFDRWVDNLVEEFANGAMPVHNDYHTFNILTKFPSDGSMTICDWEMATVGPLGRDTGIFFSWPIACALAHAAMGQQQQANDILSALDVFWQTYTAKLNKDEAYLLKAFRSTMGSASIFLFGTFYLADMFMPYLPLEGASEDLARRARAAVGLTGFRLMEYGFGGKDEHLSLTELQQALRAMIDAQMQSVRFPGQHRRRSSILRGSSRRVSDAGALEEAVHRLSSVITE